MSEAIIDWLAETDECGVLWITLDKLDIEINVLSSSFLE